MHLNSAENVCLFLRILLKNLTAAPALLKAVRPPVSHLRCIDFLLNHLKHVTGSRYAPGCSGPCASASTSFLELQVSSTFSHSVEHLLEHLHPLFSLFCLSCHTELLRELLVFACCWQCSYLSWFLGSQSLAVLLSSRPFGACFINQIQ